MTILAPVLLAAKRLTQAPIYVYRYAISPLIGPVCRYQPTCSAYALEAIENWQFEPPLRDSVPVIVRARQDFVFFDSAGAPLPEDS